MEKSESDYLEERIIGHIKNDMDKKGSVSDEEVIRIRKERVVGFFKKNYERIAYVVLAFFVYLGVKIRTSNMHGLKDITTGTWTLGPDLDPFLFYRLAKEIVEKGSLAVVDMMRYVPVGFENSRGFVLHNYLIAWFHQYLGSLFGTESVMHSAVIYPAFMFGLTMIAFFFMTRKIFSSLGGKKSNIIALAATFMLMVFPSLLARTIAGIPEKESAGFFFMFVSFYFFLSAFKADKSWAKYLLSVLAGLSTAAMALIWGGFEFIFITLVPVVFISFLLEKMGKKEITAFALWIASSFVVMNIYSDRYTFSRLFGSVTTGSAVAVLFVIILHSVIFKSNLKHYFKTGTLGKIPPKINSVIAALIIIILLSSFIFGVSYVPNQLLNVRNNLIKPATSRLIQTVAENKQPYFTEWGASFGPHVRNIPVTFWLFFAGSIYLFWKMARILKKNERLILTLSYFFFLSAVIFSRYSPSSTFNGENAMSIAFYLIGFLVFVCAFGYYYNKYYREGRLESLNKFDFGFIFALSFLFLGVISARAAVRVIMVLVPPISIIISYFAVESMSDALKIKSGAKRVIALILAGLVVVSLLFSANAYYNVVKSQASGYVPSIYTQQWQKAMAWVRNNTQEDAVFGHWWDYGYWLQSIGERATVVDGGNGISYWNHLMGRYALTGEDDRAAMDFLYAHDTTHFLIDSTDIGKYGAYSNIGSDANYDRASYIPTFARDMTRVQELKNSTVFLYNGGMSLDHDIIYDDNGTRIFIPAGGAVIGGVLVERDNSNGEIVGQSQVAIIYQGTQYLLPMRYAFDGEFIDYGKGVEAGFFMFPSVIESGAGLNIDPYGAMLYLSERTVKSQVARHYLYEEDSPYYNLVHSEDDFFVAQVKAQNPGFNSDFIQYGGLRGPIKIWELKYPGDIEIKEEYLSRVYPDELRLA